MNARRDPIDARRDPIEVRADLLDAFELPASASLEEIASAFDRWLAAAPSGGYPELEPGVIRIRITRTLFVHD